MTSVRRGTWALAIPARTRVARSVTVIIARFVRMFCLLRIELPNFLRGALNMDDHLQRVVDSLDVSPERLVNVIQCEVVSNNGVCRDLARAHEGQRAAAVHPPLASCCVDT